jgi:hypothetical protein
MRHRVLPSCQCSGHAVTAVSLWEARPSWRLLQRADWTHERVAHRSPDVGRGTAAQPPRVFGRSSPHRKE